MSSSKQRGLSFWSGIACLLTVFSLTGCGGDNGGLKLVAVSGTVTTGGSAPFANGSVNFVPKDGGKNLGGSARTDAQGNFKLKHVSGRNGIEAGDYNVTFSLFQMPDGSPLPDQSKSNDPKTPQELGGVEFVDREYSKYGSTKTPVTVEKSGGTFKFDIPELKAQPVPKAQPAPNFPGMRNRN